MAYYAVLAAKGFIRPGRPALVRRRSTRGSVTTPTAISCRESRSRAAHWVTACRSRSEPPSPSGSRTQTEPRVVVLVGDAELDEGSNHEAIALAGRLGLESADGGGGRQRSSTHGWPGGIAERFAVEGWVTQRPSTGAITTRCTPRCRRRHAPGRPRWSRRSSRSEPDHARAVRRRSSVDALDHDPRVVRRPRRHLASTVRTLADAAPPPDRSQRRHPGATAGERRRRAGTRGMRPCSTPMHRFSSSARSSR